MYEKKEALSAVRNLYPCIHRWDFHCSHFAHVAACGYRGRPDYSFGLHADENVKGDMKMKIVVMKFPKFLAGITKAIFKMKG